jgi:ABC-type amino acid transport substrate-binding protein
MSRLQGLTLLCCLAAAAAGEAQTRTGTLKTVGETGTLKVGYRENAAPFSYTGSDGKPAGYSIDLCLEIAGAVQQELKRQDLAVRWVPVTPETRIEAVASGAVDIECGSTSATLSRQEKVDFTLMTFVDGASVMIVDNPAVASLRDMGGKRIGVVPDTTTQKVLADYLREQSIAVTLVPVKDHDEGLAALQASRVDGYASDKVILAGLALRARGTTRFALLPETLSYEPYGLMVRRDDSAFRLVANRTLARIYRTGAIRTLYAKWFAGLGRPTPALLLMYNLQGLPE